MSEEQEEPEQVPTDPPATGERSDHEASPPGVEIPTEPDSHPVEDVPDSEAAEERGDE